MGGPFISSFTWTGLEKHFSHFVDLNLNRTRSCDLGVQLLYKSPSINNLVFGVKWFTCFYIPNKVKLINILLPLFCFVLLVCLFVCLFFVFYRWHYLLEVILWQHLFLVLLHLWTQVCACARPWRHWKVHPIMSRILPFRTRVSITLLAMESTVSYHILMVCCTQLMLWLTHAHSGCTWLFTTHTVMWSTKSSAGTHGRCPSRLITSVQDSM